MLRTAGGKSVALSRQLGSPGGEGTVYLLDGDGSRCVKILRETSRTSERHAKLRAMVARPPSLTTTNAPTITLAWPQEIVYEDAPGHPEFVGYIMPFLDVARLPPLQNCCYPQVRCQKYPLIQWRHMLTMAYNLAIVVYLIHKNRFRIGDFHPGNIHVDTQTSGVVLIDCDSFQISDGSRQFYCRAGKADYLAPELCGLDFGDVDVDRYSSDVFALGVIVFETLMLGFHPFSARGRGIDGRDGSKQRKIN